MKANFYEDARKVEDEITDNIVRLAKRLASKYNLNPVAVHLVLCGRVSATATVANQWFLDEEARKVGQPGICNAKELFTYTYNSNLSRLSARRAKIEAAKADANPTKPTKQAS